MRDVTLEDSREVELNRLTRVRLWEEHVAGNQEVYLGSGLGSVTESLSKSRSLACFGVFNEMVKMVLKASSSSKIIILIPHSATLSLRVCFLFVLT